MLKKKIDFSKYTNKFKSNPLPLMANEIQHRIITRTQGGKDFNLKGFKPYNKDYSKAKAKEFGSKQVNLTRSQQMLNAITWKKVERGIRFYFNSSQQNKKAFHNQVTNKRDFFFLDINQRKAVKLFIQKQLMK